MSDSVLRDLRDLRGQVIHPPDGEGKNLVDHPKRIGCMVEAVWPIPDAPSEQADILMPVIDFHAPDRIRRLLRAHDGHGAALIAIVDYENPSTLQLVLESRALAVTEKPIRPFGLLTNTILARTLWLDRRKSRRHIEKLEAKLSGHHKIQRAKATLIQTQQLNEDDAHTTIRKQAMAKRTSKEEIASAIFTAHDLLTTKSSRS